VDVRAGNDRIAEQAERLQFVSRVPMLCECGARDCRTIVLIELDEYYEVRRDPDSFLTAPGHDIEGAELETERPNYAVRRACSDRGKTNGAAARPKCSTPFAGDRRATGGRRRTLHTVRIAAADERFPRPLRGDLLGSLAVMRA
jgi:hypothetical protein